MMRSITAAFCIFSLANAAMAQCGPYKHHPLWPDTVGYANVHLDECGATSCLWDNGSTNPLTNLGVGSHWVILYNGATSDTLQFTIDQEVWDFQSAWLPTAMGLEIDIWAVITPHMAPQIFDNPKCRPDGDSTIIYLLQDGLQWDSITPIDTYAGEVHMWMGLPYGHTYQLELIDNSNCGSYALGQLVTAYSSGEAEFQINTEDACGGIGGSIGVNEVVPDPLSPFPPPTPFTGTFTLLDWPDPSGQVASPMQGTSAYWDNLPPGQYLVHFAPDSICNHSETVITIGTCTGITEDRAVLGAPLLAWPQPVHDVLHWKASDTGVVHVYDAHGRLVLSIPDRGRLDVSAMPEGLYHLQVSQGARVEWTRFLKQ